MIKNIIQEQNCFHQHLFQVITGIISIIFKGKRQKKNVFTNRPDNQILFVNNYSTVALWEVSITTLKSFDPITGDVPSLVS